MNQRHPTGQTPALAPSTRPARVPPIQRIMSQLIGVLLYANGIFWAWLFGFLQGLAA